MIKKAYEMNQQKRFRVLIYGVPGIAKSTTALSAPTPLMVDTDRGWDRIPVICRRGDYIQPESYEEILNDLKPETVKNYETIIFDTGGTLLNLMKAWAIKKDPKNGQRDSTTLSQRGYGTVGYEFVRLMDYCFYTLGKHVVVVFHAKEERDGEQNVFRLDVEGQTKNNVWKPMDVGGFMEARGNQRTIGFSPTDRYFAKGSHGISDVMEIPNVMKGAANDFLTTLFAKIINGIFEDVKLIAKYDEIMNIGKDAIEKATTAETANKTIDFFKSLDHVFASKIELWYMLKEKAENCGLIFIPKDGKFEAKK